MTRIFGSFVALSSLSGTIVIGRVVPGILLGAFAVFAIWWVAHCRHRGPLGLLPSVVNEDGTRLPTRWYCDDCGRSWTADFAHVQTPVQRFAGYDESKAVQSARRASELELRQRALAVRRSGFDLPAPKSTLRAVDAPDAPVRINSRRRMG